MDESGRSGVKPPDVDVRPLGPLAVGAGVVAVVLALTGFYAVLGVVVALVASGLGLLARTEPRTRRAGTLAVGLAVAAAAVAVVWLVLTLAG
ncbi:hypothetical protein L615_003200000020 [Nocardioides sp. J9]|uniref:hypothetical protein n=1 Tax=Nocardioides sp. J9 TaxID=935844 RepID=UPI0011A0FCD2|nr:hypothetical protein [Nocardioides sp. J9]TWG98124.1 hypothetical protein L615_003200000020 [Nocardioides sp. J9]